MRTPIVGAGVIGTVYGAHLAAAGHAVCVRGGDADPGTRRGSQELDLVESRINPVFP